MRRRSIKAAIRLFFILFAVTITTSHLLTANYFGSLENYQIILELASQNNNRLHNIALYANQIAREEDNAVNALKGEISGFDAYLDIIKNGGAVRYQAEVYELLPVEESALPVLLEIEKKWQNYKEHSKKILGLKAKLDFTLQAKNGKNITIPLNNPEMQQELFKLEQEMRELVVFNDRFINEYIEISRIQQNTADAWLLILLGVNLVSIAIGFFLIQNTLFRPLSKMTQVANLIGQGNLSHKIDLKNDNEVGFIAGAINQMIEKIGNATNFIKNIEEGKLNVAYSREEDTKLLENDTLANALINMREQMKKVAEEEKERSWVTQGLTQFARILQTYNQDTNTLAYEITAETVRYTDAAIGGFYIVREEEEEYVHFYSNGVELSDARLELIASYAYDRKRAIKREIKPGEGIIGQAYKDKELIYITDIPKSYWAITSGLGKSLPKSLIAIPLKMNDIVYGVIELASFKHLKPYQIEFLERISENIAATLNSTLANERTQQLLRESEEVAKIMQKKDSEMRYNLSELQKVQRETQRNQALLAAQSYTIKSTLVYVELDLDANILTTNELFRETMGYTEEELKNKNYGMFIFKESDQDRYDYQQIWAEIKRGEPVSGSFKRKAKDGTIRWLRATYSAVRDENAQIVKILKIAFDITPEKMARLNYEEQLTSFRRFNATVEFNLQGQFLDANDIFLDLIGYTKDELLMEDHAILVPKEERNTLEYNDLWRRLRRGEPIKHEVRRIRKDGKEVWLQGSFNPINDLSGKPYKVIEFINDITERKKAEQELIIAQKQAKEEGAKLSALINNTDDIILAIDKNYQLTLFNESAKHNFELWETPLSLGMDFRTTFTLKDRITLTDLYEKALKGEKFNKSLLINKHFNKGVYLSMSFNPIKDSNDTVQGVSVFAKNVTSKIQKKLKN